jgi:dTDP-4-dehydrorhamnose 3,5-epimerase
MEIKIESRHLQDVAVLVPDIFQDSRGFFMETFREDQFKAHGLPYHFVQDNHSRSAKGVVRGLHFQWEPPMGKLMRVTQGKAFLVAVDIRKGSPTLGKWVGIEASAENRREVWAPAGFARGFCVLSDSAEIQYKCTRTTTRANPAFCGTIRQSASNGRWRTRNFLRRTRKRKRWPRGWLRQHPKILNTDPDP